MKYTIACLVGLAAAKRAEPVWSLRSINDHKTDSQHMDHYGQHSIKQADARPPMRSHLGVWAEVESDSDDTSSSDSDLQMGSDEEEVDHSKEHFTPQEHEMEGNDGYNRVPTAHFSADTDDIFMRSMIQQYSLEGKNKDGSPNGTFTMTEAAARAAAAEVLHTHKGMSGADLNTYLDTYFPRTWSHFDVNRGGSIEVIKMPQLMRFLASDQQMYLW